MRYSTTDIICRCSDSIASTRDINLLASLSKELNNASFNSLEFVTTRLQFLFFDTHITATAFWSFKLTKIAKKELVPANRLGRGITDHLPESFFITLFSETCIVQEKSKGYYHPDAPPDR